MSLIGFFCLLIYITLSLLISLLFFMNLPFGDLSKTDFILYKIWHCKSLTNFGIFFCTLMVLIGAPLIIIFDLIFICSLKK